MTIPEKFAMTGSRSSIHRDHNGDLIKLDESISPPGSIETTSPGETELALPEEQKLVKRKGGRKPIYATTEERKQRNREAQAAFRERRNEYIKKLQKELDEQKAELELSQQNHRTAADECLILRYKCSLLEKILAEKGIDSEAEMKILADNPAPSIYPIGPRPPGQRSGFRTILSRPTEAQRAAAGLLPDRQDPSSLEFEQKQKNMALSSPMTAAASTSQTPSPPASPSAVQQGGFQGINNHAQHIARPLQQQQRSNQKTGSVCSNMQQQLPHQARQDKFNAAPSVQLNNTENERRSGSAGRSAGQPRTSLLPHLPLDRRHRPSTEEADGPFHPEGIRTLNSSSPCQVAGPGYRAPDSHNIRVAFDGSGPSQPSIIKNAHQPQLPFQHAPTTPVTYTQPFHSDMIPGQVNTYNQYSALPQTHPQTRLASANASYVNSNNTFGDHNDMYLPIDTSMHGDPYTLHNNLEYRTQYSQQCAHERR